MISLLCVTAFAAPHLTWEHQLYLFRDQYGSGRNSFSFSYKEKPWKFSLHTVHSWDANTSELALQSWSLEHTKVWKSTQLKLGHGILRWGQLDALSDINALSGFDLRFGPTLQPEFRQLPLPYVSITQSKTHLQASLYWLPFSARDAIPWLGHPFGVISPQQVQQSIDEAQSWPGDWISEPLLYDLLSGLSDQIDAQTVLPVPEKHTLDYGDVALKLGYNSIESSSHLYIAWMRNRRPLLRLDKTLRQYLEEERLPTSLELDALNDAIVDPFYVDYPRTLLVGLDLSTTLSIFGLRAELCYQNNRTFAQWYLNGTTVPYGSAGLALDTLIGTHLFALEARYHRFIDPPSQAWLTAPETLQLSLLSQLQLPAQSTLQIISQYDLALEDLFVHFILAYPVRDDVEIALRGSFFNGITGDSWFRRAGGIYGSWKNQDHLIAQLQWSP